MKPIRAVKTIAALALFLITFSCIESDEFSKTSQPAPERENPFSRNDTEKQPTAVGIHGYEDVAPGSSHQYTVEFFGGNDVVLDGSETIVWMLRGNASYNQALFDHYFDCVNNGDCDGDLDCQYCEGPEVVDFWYAHTTATTVNITFPNVEPIKIYTLAAAVICGDECLGPSENLTIEIREDGM